MPFNLLEAVKQKLGYDAISKVDPNTQEVEKPYKVPDSEKFAQASIPTVLTALYRYSQTEEGAASLLAGSLSTDWMDLLFGEHAAEAVEKVADYSMQSYDITRDKMDEIASTSMILVGEQLSEGDKVRHLKDFMTHQKNNILPHLPAALQIGKLLGDDTLDDRTNKMEGPVSSFMHTIESAMSASGKRNTERE